MNDPFLKQNECVNRLLLDYHKHKKLLIAFDFDNTIYDYHKVGDTYNKVISVLREVRRRGWPLILFTAREDDELQDAEYFCQQHGITPDYVNDSPITETRKPYYNLLLDDRAGLPSAYNTLITVLKMTEK